MGEAGRRLIVVAAEAKAPLVYAVEGALVAAIAAPELIAVAIGVGVVQFVPVPHILQM